jgi:hypothetical protein
MRMTKTAATYKEMAEHLSGENSTHKAEVAELKRAIKRLEDVNESMAEKLGAARTDCEYQTKALADRAQRDAALPFRMIIVKVIDSKGSVINENLMALNQGDFMRAEITSDGWIDARVKRNDA